MNYQEHAQYQLEIVRKIERYGPRYNPDSGLSLEDQLLACEAIAESTPVKPKTADTKSEQELSVRGSVSGACYSEVNFELISSYSEAILELKHRTSETAPNEIAGILEKAFGPSRQGGHWLWLSQRWNPRQITWVLIGIFKDIQSGQISPQKAADCFTFRLKKRRKKKKLFKKRGEA